LLIFSAATPGQGGTHHINEQRIEFWCSELKDLGFVPIDLFRNSFKRNKLIPNYYSNNTLLFVNTNLDGFKLLNLDQVVKSPIISLYDIRQVTLKVRHKILSFFPIVFVTLLSRIKNIIAN
jgi:hypothetical protein